MARTIDFFEVANTVEVSSKPSKPSKADQRIAEYVRTRHRNPPPDLILEWRQQQRRARRSRRLILAVAILVGAGLTVALWPLLLGIVLVTGAILLSIELTAVSGPALLWGVALVTAAGG